MLHILPLRVRWPHHVVTQGCGSEPASENAAQDSDGLFQRDLLVLDVFVLLCGLQDSALQRNTPQPHTAPHSC